MRSVFCLAFPIALMLVGCGDEPQIERRTINYPNGKSVSEDWTFVRQPNGDTTKHGVHKKFFWNGNTSESVIWKMGQRDGSAQAWYENGAVKWQKSYQEGKKHRTWHLFYQDGHPWIVAHYDKDLLTGTVQVWDKVDATEARSAEFANGACKSGDCALLEPSVLPPDIPAGEMVEMTRAWDIVKEFQN
ncbi:MAG: hypothetical protein M3Y08_07580 [Fibrobacterota bacterium]|nr:hypothetical protein [Fibrobacterota bacterium]